MNEENHEYAAAEMADMPGAPPNFLINGGNHNHNHYYGPQAPLPTPSPYPMQRAMLGLPHTHTTFAYFAQNWATVNCTQNVNEFLRMALNSQQLILLGTLPFCVDTQWRICVRTPYSALTLYCVACQRAVVLNQEENGLRVEVSAVWCVCMSNEFARHVLLVRLTQMLLDNNNIPQNMRLRANPRQLFDAIRTYVAEHVACDEWLGLLRTELLTYMGNNGSSSSFDGFCRRHLLPFVRNNQLNSNPRMH